MMWGRKKQNLMSCSNDEVEYCILGDYLEEILSLGRNK